MAITSSIISRSSTSGMNPAPMPWICISSSIPTHQPCNEGVRPSCLQSAQCSLTGGHGHSRSNLASQHTSH
jgi:hypothetical protein